jgi:D-alanyl-D-alanine carboxypeptidase
MSAELFATYEERVAQTLVALGIPATHGKKSGLRIFLEAEELVSVGLDIYEREQKLAPRGAIAWRELKLAAERDGVALLLVSAFRSFDYQKQIIERKRQEFQWSKFFESVQLPVTANIILAGQLMSPPRIASHSRKNLNTLQHSRGLATAQRNLDLQ